MSRKNLLQIFILSLFMSNFAFAKINIINQNTNRCGRYFSYYENKYNIPQNLLKALSIQESGIYHTSDRSMYPWPWTINYKGKGYYFESKKAAIIAVKKIFMKGDRSVDVGCMQINLHYHANAFKSLEHAFDPKSNIEYGAKLLQGHYNRSKDWGKAVGLYHSNNLLKSKNYSNKVLSIWNNSNKKYVPSSKDVILSSSKNIRKNSRENPLMIKIKLSNNANKDKEIAKISTETINKFKKR